MKRRRAAGLAEALVAAAILAAVGGALVLALAHATQAGQRAVLAAQARRLLQQELEQVRSGRGIPASGTSGPFTVTVSSSAAPQPGLRTGAPAWTPDCYGGSPCTNWMSAAGATSLTNVVITITYTADGSVVASGQTTTPP